MTLQKFFTQHAEGLVAGCAVLCGVALLALNRGNRYGHRQAAHGNAINKLCTEAMKGTGGFRPNKGGNNKMNYRPGGKF